MAECAVLTMGGKDREPLRFPRPVTALAAVGTAAIAIGLSAVPAAADQVRGEEWWLSSLSVTSIWPASQGAGVTVAVLSDGVLASEPDLTGAVTAAPALAGAPVAVGQYLGEQGTPIASLIAGHGHGRSGGAGVIGVAPRARILSVPVTLPPDDPQLGQPAVAAAIPGAIAAGIKYAVNHGASVIDLPIDPGQPGSSGTSGAAAAAGGSAAEASAVSYALAHNVVLVAPAGDNALATDAPNYPAAYPGVIAVGAFDSAFNKAPWTSQRGYVAVTAAGAGVVAASANGGYETMNSTSAASAVVAGIVALIRSRYPGLSVPAIRHALTTTTLYQRRGGLASGSGYGAVDAAKAFSAAAALGTPAGERAGAGAQPLVTPSPAAAGVGAQSLDAQIVRAGEISGGVLVLLLLAVVSYALIGRRRRPSRLPATLAAQWTAGQAQTRYPHAPVTDADRMLEYFAAPLATPDQASGRPEVTDVTARGALAGGVRRGDDNLFDAAPGGVERWVQSGPASRAVAKRPSVSGTPPWEPAPLPEGELPWTDAPPRQTVPGQVVASGYPVPPPGAAPTAAAAPDLPALDPAPAAPTPAPAALPYWSRVPAEPDARQNRWQYDETDWASPSGREYPPQRRDRIDASAGSEWAEPTAHGDSPAALDAGGESAAAWQGDAGPADWSAGESAGPPSAQHRSGLPIRQPRSVTSAPRSPSGSLWERPARTPSAQGEPADPGDEPVYVWDQGQTGRRR